jgi:hypothetical protein
VSVFSQLKSRYLILLVVLALGGFAPRSQAALDLGSAATLATSTAFDGIIIASQGITLATGADLGEQALAFHAGLYLDNSPAIMMPETGTLITGALPLLPFGACWLRRRLGRRKQTAS